MSDRIPIQPPQALLHTQAVAKLHMAQAAQLVVARTTSPLGSVVAVTRLALWGIWRGKRANATICLVWLMTRPRTLHDGHVTHIDEMLGTGRWRMGCCWAG
jgi:hypothetical protein